ncbi:MAG: tetratricopeptide repeat protein [Campylobacterales bacterium]|nr:tetratricopeptide repeat protein [Campylobacterales bacterium]
MKTLRLFISSTFDDFKDERDAIQAELIPHLTNLCKKYSVGFMPIDLRWGVAAETQHDQKTMELCLNEVKACKGEPNPDFLILTGDRYGWIPLPYMIEKDEFETLYSFIKVADKELINKWYMLDENQLPASYILQKRENEFTDYDTWMTIENKLRTILQESITQTDYSQEIKDKYFTSATEFEYLDYIKDFIGEKNEALFVVDRKINNNGIISDKYFDNNQRLKKFKKALQDKAPDEHYIISHTTLKPKTYPKEKDVIETLHVNSLIEQLKEKLSASIEKELIRVSAYDTAISEQEIHRLHKNSIAKNILGRDEEINEIQEYINTDTSSNPYIIYGTSGLGESSVMACGILQSEEAPNKQVICRFCGITKESSSTRSLLKSIFKELDIELPEEQAEQTTMMQEMTAKKEDTFELDVQDAFVNIKEDVVIYIDALDQLGDKSKLEWLPFTLPKNLKIVLSVLKDENYQEDIYYHDKLEELGFNNMHPLSVLSSSDIAKKILLNTLKPYNRTLQNNQIEYIMNLYKEINSPLYLNIIAQEALHWSSNKKDFELANTQQDAIHEFIKNLTELYHHNKLLIQRVFGYLFASQNSLDEAILYEILSNDEELVKNTENEYHTNVTKKLPMSVWARLSYQIAPFLKEDENAKIKFFHREFGEGAKALYSVELSQKLLNILQNMLDATTLNDEKESLTDIYIKTLMHQKYLYPESSIEEQVQYLSTKVKSDEVWVRNFITKILQLGEKFYQQTEDKWAKAYNQCNMDIAQELYDIDKKLWQEVYIKALRNLALSFLIEYEEEDGFFLLNKLQLILQDLYVQDEKIWLTYADALTLNAGAYSKSDNRFKDAIQFQEKSYSILKLHKESSEKWAESYTRALSRLATLYATEGNFQNAIPLQQEALGILENLYDTNKKRWAEDYTSTLKNLGVSYTFISQFKDAIQLLESSKEILKNLFQENRIRWADGYTTSLNNLALIYKQTGATSEAMKLEEESWEILEKLYNKNPKRWVESYLLASNSLAISYYKANFLDKGVELLGKSYLVAIKFLTKNHQLTQKIKENYDESLRKSKIDNFDQDLTTILSLSKAIAMMNHSFTIDLSHLLESLDYVQLSGKAYMAFMEIFDFNPQQIEKREDVKILLEMAKNHPKIPYTQDFKSLIEQLKELFVDEKICRLR